MKTTPGPWKGARFTVIGGAHRRTICAMKNTHYEEEADGNVVLISLAPEMADALRETTEQMTEAHEDELCHSHHGAPEEDCTYCQQIKAKNALLAKLEGTT